MSSLQHNKEKYVIYSSICITVISWIYVMYSYNSLPDKIVAHMNLNGDINRYDSRNTIWFILILFTVLNVFFYWLSNNIIQPENKKTSRIYLLIVMPFLSLILLGLCILMIQKTFNPEFNSNFIMYFFLAITIALVFSSIYYQFKFNKND